MKSMFNLKLLAIAVMTVAGSFCFAQNKMVEKKTAVVKHVAFENEVPTMAEISEMFTKSGAESYKVDVANWPERNGGYSPEASFSMIYSDTDLYIRYKVKEKALKAVYGSDEGAKPWTDDCMELFIIPNLEDMVYFNIEMNCVGKGIIGRGALRKDRIRYTPEELKRVRRFSTLGGEAFGIRELPADSGEWYEWSMTIVVPLDMLCGEKGVDIVKGKTVLGNVYKCGDEMPQSHYLTWSPIGTPKPDYHVPEYFGYLKFEE
ncbi:MAG: carbohydrate-binding family 9-like protein [Candidatus Egerieousia sp.]